MFPPLCCHRVVSALLFGTISAKNIYSHKWQSFSRIRVKPRDHLCNVVSLFCLFPGFFYIVHGTTQYKFDLQTKRILSIDRVNSWFNC